MKFLIVSKNYENDLRTRNKLELFPSQKCL